MSISNLTTDTLEQIIKRETISVEVDEPRKGDLVKSVEHFIDSTGLNITTSELKQDELRTMCEHIKIDLSEAGKNPTKAVLRKRLAEKAQELGLEKFLGKFADNKDIIEALSDTCGLEEVSDSDDLKKVAKNIAKQITQVGTTALFERFDTPFLKEVAQELKLKVENPNKNRYVEAIVTGKNLKAPKSTTQSKAKKEALKEAEEAASKDKPSIKKGVSYQDLFQHYTRTELFDWCKDNGLKVSGNKKELIKRILAFFDGDTENTLAGTVKRGRSRSRSRSKSPSKKKKTSKKDTSKSPKKDSKKSTKKDDDKEKKDDSEKRSRSKSPNRSKSPVTRSQSRSRSRSRSRSKSPASKKSKTDNKKKS